MKTVTLRVEKWGDKYLLSPKQWNTIVRWLKAHGVSIEVKE